MVTYDCDFEMGIALEWILEPYFPRSDPIRFLASQPIGTTVDCNDATTVQCVDINFVANLTNVANPMTVEAAMVFDMNSTLTIYAAPGLNVSMLQCKGTVQTGGVIIENITLNFSGAFMLYYDVCWAITAELYHTKDPHINIMKANVLYNTFDL